ncbi:MAG: hypothetical protein D6698_12310, partial [Gammaproteobacteria bacterium]
GIGTNAPTTELEVAGDILLHNGVTDGKIIFKDNNIAHGLTDIVATDTNAQITTNSNANGGIQILGVTDADLTSAIDLYGILGITDPTDPTPAITLNGAKKNTTNVQSLANAETVFQIQNNTSPLLSVLGDGSVGIGTTSPAAKLHLHTTSGIGSDAFLEFSRGTSSGKSVFTQYTNSGADYGLKIGNSTSDWITLNQYNGHLGLDTASPQTLLSLGDTSYTFASGGLSFGDGDTGFYESADDTLVLRNAGADVLAINSSNIYPSVAGGMVLGSATNEFNGLYLGDSGSLYLGSDQDWTLAFDQATDNRLELSTTGATGLAFSTAATTADAFTFLSDSLTTGTAINLSVDALTTGTGLNITSTSTSLDTSVLGGSLLNLDWSPGTATTITTDLFALNIGANGAIDGNLFGIYNNGSDVFTVSQTGIESAVPHSFTAAGDVTIAYDVVLTNQTSSKIHSYGPLTIEAGESFENNNLTFTTHGTGDIIYGMGGTNTFIFNNDGDLGIGGTTSILDHSNIPEGSLVVMNGIICVDDNGGQGCDDAARTPGTVYSVNSAVTGIDLAENYPSLQQLEPGEIVTVDPGNNTHVIRTTSAYEGKYIGIVSSDPGVLLGGYKTEPVPGATSYPIALRGRVPLKVTTQNGNIAKGDPLVASDTPGAAMKANQAGQIIGRALEDYTGSGTGTIIAFVETGWYDPHVLVDGSGNFNYSGNANFNGNVNITNTLTVGGVDMAAALADVQTDVTNLLADVSSIESTLNTLQSAISSNSASINLLSQQITTDRLGVGTSAPATSSGKLIDTVSGAYLSDSGVWTNVSDVNKKENFTALDKDLILDKISNLNITQWNYKTDSDNITHIGPTAQDFYHTFGIGENDTTISTLDPAGVALVGIQALAQKVGKLEELTLNQNGEINLQEIEARLTALEAEQQNRSSERTVLSPDILARLDQLESELAHLKDQKASDSARVANLTNEISSAQASLSALLTTNASASGVVSGIATDSPTLAAVAIPNATPSADLEITDLLTSTASAELLSDVQSVTTNNINDLENDLDLLNSTINLVDHTLSLETQATQTLTQNTASQLEALQVTKKAVLNDVGITGVLNAGFIEINGIESTISTTIEPLRLQSNTLAGNVDIFNGQILMTQQGNIDIAGTLTAQKVIAKDIESQTVEAKTAVLGKIHVATSSAQLSLIASASATLRPERTVLSEASASAITIDPSIGQASLPPRRGRIFVKNTSVTQNSKIFITPTTITDKILSVTDIIEGQGFTVATKNASSQKIEFNYWIIN